ncbi:unnamed protein product [Umbelopsis ramanniana]
MEPTKLPAEGHSPDLQPAVITPTEVSSKTLAKKRSRLSRELGSLREDNAKKARRDWPKCPICGVPVEPAQYENHYQIELYELQQLNFGDYELSKARGKRGAAVVAKKQLEKTTGKRKVSSRYEECLSKVRKNREARSSAIKTTTSGTAASDVAWNPPVENQESYTSFDTGLQQTCFICNQVLSGDTESVNLHIDGCLARVNSEDNDGSSMNHEATLKSSASPTIDDGEGDLTPEAAWEEYEWAGQRRVRATAMFEGGYGGAGMSTTVKGEDVDDDLDVEDDDVNQYGEAQYSERDIVVNPDDENEDSAALREMVSGTPISRSSSSGPSGQGQSAQRPGYEATVSDDGWMQHLTKDAVIPTNAAGHTKLVIESLRSQINQLESASRSVPKCLICLEPYKTPLTSVVCWHVHCEECWLHSMGTKKLCPQCQKIVTPADLRRIYL